MSWKASLLGALIVSVAGLAVGVGIGGKTKTHTRIVTVAQKAPSPAPTVTTETTTTSSETQQATSTGAAVQTQYLDETPAEQVSATNMGVDTTTRQAVVGGEHLQEVVLLNPFSSSTGQPAEAVFSTENPQLQVFQATAGLDQGESPTTDVSLDIRENTIHGRELIPSPIRFTGPSPRTLSVALHGARNIDFIITDNTCPERCQGTRNPFVLGNARFTP